MSGAVDNLLKYTGYGNAAGLLVARGLLAGGRGETQYSEDEDSDTEEYKSAKPLYVAPPPALAACWRLPNEHVVLLVPASTPSPVTSRNPCPTPWRR